MRIAIRHDPRASDDQETGGKEPATKRALPIGASVMAFAAMILVGSVTAAFAGAEAGTVGAGSTYYPTASPYHSYAHVTKCHSANGSAPFYQGEVNLGTDWVKGPRQAFPGPDSTVSLHRIGSYRGNWYCRNLG
jgi:hypothetical protein